MGPDRIVLSPGPFDPTRAGVCPDVVRAFAGKVPILGVCLGMQVIAHVLGAEVRASGQPMHGKSSSIHHDDAGVLRGLPDPFDGARYHSLIVGKSPNMTVSAWTEDGTIMGIRAKGVEGVLFHPESFLTPQGSLVFQNFLRPSYVV